MAQGRAGWTGSALRRIEKGRNTKIEDAGYRGIPTPEYDAQTGTWQMQKQTASG